MRLIDRGFTLIEMMVIISIIAILSAIAVPAFSQIIAKQRIKNAAGDFVHHAALARAEAVSRSRRVGLSRTGNDWAGGWKVFVDANRNGVLDNGEVVIAEQLALDASLKGCAVNTTGTEITLSALVFGPDGRVRAYNDTPSEISTMDGVKFSASNVSAARLASIGLTGRASVKNASGGCA